MTEKKEEYRAMSEEEKRIREEIRRDMSPNIFLGKIKSPNPREWNKVKQILSRECFNRRVSISLLEYKTGWRKREGLLVLQGPDKHSISSVMEALQLRIVRKYDKARMDFARSGKETEFRKELGKE